MALAGCERIDDNGGPPGGSGYGSGNRRKARTVRRAARSHVRFMGADVQAENKQSEPILVELMRASTLAS
jgi:hypothetical protein